MRNPPKKIKVYRTAVSNDVRYGEVLGVSNDHKLIVEERPEFSDLCAHHFDYFREAKQVIFLSEIAAQLYERS